MSKFELFKTEDIYELKHQLKTIICLFLIILGKDSVVVNQPSTLMNKVDMNKITFSKCFDRDASFGIKFFYRVRRFLQQFLSSFYNVSYMEDVNFDLISLSHIQLVPSQDAPYALSLWYVSKINYLL